MLGGPSRAWDIWVAPLFLVSLLSLSGGIRTAHDGMIESHSFQRRGQRRQQSWPMINRARPGRQQNFKNQKLYKPTVGPLCTNAPPNPRKKKRLLSAGGCHYTPRLDDDNLERTLECRRWFSAHARGWKKKYGWNRARERKKKDFEQRHVDRRSVSLVTERNRIVKNTKGWKKQNKTHLLSFIP